MNRAEIRGARLLLAQNATNVDDPLARPAATSGSAAESSTEEFERAANYRLLATLLSEAPDRSLLDQIVGLDLTPYGETPYVRALAALSAAARDATPQSAEDEFQALFIGIGEGELVPYGSYYQTGFLHERPLARLRGDMRALGIERPGGVAEPEDGIASLCEIMAGLISGAFGESETVARQATFFEDHLAPWAGLFFRDLEAANAAKFYASVGALGREFFDIESEAFTITG